MAWQMGGAIARAIQPFPLRLPRRLGEQYYQRTEPPQNLRETMADHSVWERLACRAATMWKIPGRLGNFLSMMEYLDIIQGCDVAAMMEEMRLANGIVKHLTSLEIRSSEQAVDEERLERLVERLLDSSFRDQASISLHEYIHMRERSIRSFLCMLLTGNQASTEKGEDFVLPPNRVWTELLYLLMGSALLR